VIAIAPRCCAEIPHAFERVDRRTASIFWIVRACRIILNFTRPATEQRRRAGRFSPTATAAMTVQIRMVRNRRVSRRCIFSVSDQIHSSTNPRVMCFEPRAPTVDPQSEDVEGMLDCTNDCGGRGDHATFPDSMHSSAERRISPGDDDPGSLHKTRHQNMALRDSAPRIRLPWLVFRH
jgi:hypothetical protein